jgi:hypothetical protein
MSLSPVRPSPPQRNGGRTWINRVQHFHKHFRGGIKVGIDIRADAREHGGSDRRGLFGREPYDSDIENVRTQLDRGPIRCQAPDGHNLGNVGAASPDRLDRVGNDKGGTLLGSSQNMKRAMARFNAAQNAALTSVPMRKTAAGERSAKD